LHLGMALSSHHQQADQRIFTTTSKSRPPDNNIENENTQPKPPTIWIHLPFIGKRGTSLIRSCTNKISRLLTARPKFITIYNTTSTNTYLSLKDRTDKELQSSVVYKFSCPDCQLSYIGKLTAASEQGLKNTPPTKTQKFTNILCHVNISNTSRFYLTYLTHYWISLIHISQKPSYTKTALYIGHYCYIRSLYIFIAKNRNLITELKPLRNL
jgi:hypothetical protein